ncbi:MAG TPA: hypothetical protein PK504_11445 [Ferruginibacter sp.]|nr:hypothetical protein [Ferruginibacter sp.]HRE64190.1 hypothetical protein [Ferruginibacter sp.]
MTKYSKWIGIAAAMGLIVICFLPWTYHADIQKIFTGFFSEQDKYGKPGKFLIALSVIAIVLFLVQKIWAKRTNLFITGLMVAYAIKTFILYSSCYNAYCPEKRLGIYLVLLLPIVQFIASLFPDVDVNTDKQV